MNMEWNKTNKSFMVNIYYIKKMIGKEKTIGEVIEMMKQSYEADNGTRRYKNMTFIEYVNEKRCFIASIMGLPEYF